MYIYEKPDNLVELFMESRRKFPGNPLFGTKNPTGSYDWITYEKIGKRIDNLRAGLAKTGVRKGDGVGIIANNRAEWAICAFASFGLVAEFVPMYEKELLTTWEYIINDSGIKVLFVSAKKIYDAIAKLSGSPGGLEHIFIIDAKGDNSMAALENMGSENPVEPLIPSPHDIATLIYTSGTTGNPKGVLLSHGNFTSNVHGGGKIFHHLNYSDRSISILPWAHSFGQTAELYNFIRIGGSIGFMENVTTLAEDIQKIKPTTLIGVPRVFNKIYDGIRAKAEESGGLKRKLFVKAIENAEKRRIMADKGMYDFMTDIKHKFYDALIFKKIREKLGGNLRFAISGSATMNVKIGYFFSNIGIPVYDCYGLTETSPAVTMNGPDENRPGSVGKPLDQVKVIIDRNFPCDNPDEGEIIVYGPNVMKGYYNNPAATKEVMTSGGGFKTGDMGKLDKDGFLYITGRIKEQYKLENGKYVFPAALEEEIRLVPCVDQAMIFGEGKRYNICLIVPDFEVLKKAVGNMVGNMVEDMVENLELKKFIENSVTKFLKGKFGGYEIPRKFIILKQGFTIDNGMLTQTMKLKRREVLKKYKQEIEKLYEEE